MMTPTTGLTADFFDTFSATTGGKVFDYHTEALNKHYGASRSKSAFTVALYLISPALKPISALPP